MSSRALFIMYLIIAIVLVGTTMTTAYGNIAGWFSHDLLGTIIYVILVASQMFFLMFSCGAGRYYRLAMDAEKALNTGCDCTKSSL